MPIHFSIGFVVENRPRRQFETVCAVIYDVEELNGVLCSTQEVRSLWKREYGKCK